MNGVLLIFIKNPVLGKVKTRLAKSMGDEKALMIYKELLKKTLAAAAGAACTRELWYSSKIDEKDEADPELFEKKLQQGGDLGERMSRSFSLAFENGYEKTVVIGSDCPDLTSDRIEEAFQCLDDAELVMGPSPDGGYYLMGMKKYHPELFEGIAWSEPTVYGSTTRIAEKLGLNIRELPPLNDIDTLEDFMNSSMNLR